jgi:peptidoglycan-associated lipoprotein
MMFFRYSLIASALLILTACAGTNTDTATATNPAPTAATSGQKNTTALSVDTSLQRVVHFSFDSSALDDKNRKTIEANGRYLMAHSSVVVLVEGYADERGTRAYNLALGERRAQSIARVFKALGIGDKRIQVVSYGEEKPAAKGHDELAWTQNRRAEINYRQ